MKIICPECQHDFDVPLALLGPEGRKVKCANCRHVWHTGGIEPDLPPAPSPYTKPADPISTTGFEIDFDLHKAQAAREQVPSFKDIIKDESKKAKIPSISLSPALFKTAGIAIATGALVVGLLAVLKTPVTTVIPAMIPFYQGLGMKVALPAEGAAIDRLILRAMRSGGQTNIEVTTKIINLTEDNVTLSPILFEMVDGQMKPTGQEWRFDPPAEVIKPGESLPFSPTLEKIPADSESVQLRARFVR